MTVSAAIALCSLTSFTMLPELPLEVWRHILHIAMSTPDPLESPLRFCRYRVTSEQILGWHERKRYKRSMVRIARSPIDSHTHKQIVYEEKHNPRLLSMERNRDSVSVRAYRHSSTSMLGETARDPGTILEAKSNKASGITYQKTGYL